MDGRRRILQSLTKIKRSLKEVSFKPKVLSWSKVTSWSKVMSWPKFMFWPNYIQIQSFLASSSLLISYNRFKRRTQNFFKLNSWGLSGMLSVMLAGLLGYIYYEDGNLNSITNRAHRLVEKATIAAGFSIDEVRIEGLDHLNQSVILSHLNLQDNRSILLLDAEQAHQKITNIPWVKSASLLKLMPNRLLIDIKENQPLARWQFAGKTRIIDHEGRVLDIDSPRYYNLPLLLGYNANKQAAEMLEKVNAIPEIAKQVQGLSYISNRRWDIILKNNLVLKLPQKNMSFALERLVNLQHQKNIFSKDIAVIDLRVPDRLIVKLTDLGQSRFAKHLKSNPNNGLVIKTNGEGL